MKDVLRKAIEISQSISEHLRDGLSNNLLPLSRS